MSRRILRIKEDPSKEAKRQEQIVASVAIELQRRDSIKREQREIEQERTRAEKDLSRKNDVVVGLNNSIKELESRIEELKQKRNEASMLLSASENALKAYNTYFLNEKRHGDEELRELRSKIENERIVFENREKEYKASLSDIVYSIEQKQNVLSATQVNIGILEGETKNLIQRKDEIVSSIKSRTSQLEYLETLVKSVSEKRGSIELELLDSSKRFSEMQDKIEKSSAVLSVKESELNMKDAEITRLKNQMIGIVRREERVNELVPRLKELYERAGVKIEI